MRLTTAAQMRELDRQAIEGGIPSLDLMERAAEGVARAALELLPDRPGKCRAAVFCGAGNNGGDGIVAARLLFLKGVHNRKRLAVLFAHNAQPVVRPVGQVKAHHQHLARRYRNLLHIASSLQFIEFHKLLKRAMRLG